MRLLLLMIVIAVFSITLKAQELESVKGEQSKYGKLYFFVEAYDSWCYAFNYEFKEVYPKWSQYFDIIVVPVGKYAGEKAFKPAEKKDELHQLSQDVNRVSQMKFDTRYLYGVLIDNEFVANSEMPSRAINAVAGLAPEKIHDFIANLHLEYFYYGRDISDSDLLQRVAKKYVPDINEFKTYMNSTENIELTKSNFELANEKTTHIPTLYYEGEHFDRIVYKAYANSGSIDHTLTMLIDEIVFFKENPDWQTEPEGDKFKRLDK